MGMGQNETTRIWTAGFSPCLVRIYQGSLHFPFGRRAKENGLGLHSHVGCSPKKETGAFEPFWPMKGGASLGGGEI